MIFWSFSIIQLLLVASASGTGSSSALSSAIDGTTIVVHERGVARQQETSKKIHCENIVWQIDWKSNAKGEITDIEIVYISNGVSTILFDEAIELKSKAENLESISASCNARSQGLSAISSLSLLATDKESGSYIIGQLEIDVENSRAKWHFMPRE